MKNNVISAETEINFVQSKLFSLYGDKETILPVVAFGRNGEKIESVLVWINHLEQVERFDIADVKVLAPAVKVIF